MEKEELVTVLGFHDVVGLLPRFMGLGWIFFFFFGGAASGVSLISA